MFGLPKSKKRKQQQIFIVEDSRTFLIGLKSKLRLSYNDQVLVKGYTDSPSFLEELNEEPEIIIMDFHLGDDSPEQGLELLAEIKKRAPKSFVFVLTGEKDVDVAKKCFDQGADSYIVKTTDSLDKIVDEIKYKVGLKNFI